MKNTISSEIYESVKMGRLIKTHEKTQCFSKLCFGGEGRGKRFIKCGQKNDCNYCDFLSKIKKKNV